MKETILKKVPRRPVFLFIVGAVSIFSNVLSIIITALILAGGRTSLFLSSIPIIDIMAEELKHGTVFFYIIKISVHIFCIYAVILITRRLKRGFLFYVICQVVLLVLPWLFLLSLGVNYLLMVTGISLIFSLFFMMLFALYLPEKAKKPDNPIS
ncbi:MAG TPA: hypothetical protein PKI01_01630 [Bacteroidales bacterium]|nr:hypothetical protein [Bacteroidales bacterium]